MSFAPRASAFSNSSGLQSVFAGGFTTNGAGAVTEVSGVVYQVTPYTTLGGAAFYRVKVSPSIPLDRTDLMVGVKFGSAIDHTAVLADLDPNPNVARAADEFDVVVLQAGIEVAPVGAEVSIFGAFSA